MKKTLLIILCVVSLYGQDRVSPGALARVAPEKIIVLFSIFPAIPQAKEQVKFYDNSTGDLVSWRWAFGDGSISMEQNPIHAFASEGFYNVRLAVKDRRGRRKSNVIMITIVPELRAWFSWFPENPIANIPMQFRDESTGVDIVRWFWDFGDGQSSTEQNPVHTYSKAGDYSVSLTIWNTSGGKLLKSRKL